MFQIFIIFFCFFLANKQKQSYNKDMKKQTCILDETKECDNCLECEICDLDPDKICDNCGKCLEYKDFASIKIDGIFTDPEKVPKKYR